jgi:hypothetical protein
LNDQVFLADRMQKKKERDGVQRLFEQFKGETKNTRRTKNGLEEKKKLKKLNIDHFVQILLDQTV